MAKTQIFNGEEVERGCDSMTIEEVAFRLGMKMESIKARHRAGMYREWLEYVEPEADKSNGKWIVRRRAYERWATGQTLPEIHQYSIVVLDSPEKVDAFASHVVAQSARIGR